MVAGGRACRRALCGKTSVGAACDRDVKMLVAARAICYLCKVCKVILQNRMRTIVLSAANFF